MNQQPGAYDSPVIGYLRLRIALGVIGVAFPFVLAIGKVLLDGPGIENSISAYYYTVMRDFWVGISFATAVFFVSYRGYDCDWIFGWIACACAIGMALLPIAPEINATAHQKEIGTIHSVLGACYFLTLAYFSLVLFRKGDPARAPTPRKLQRNLVYAICGWTILACLALVVVVEMMPAAAPVKKLHPVFWLESIALVAFGLSWLTKGEAILQDAET